MLLSQWTCFHRECGRKSSDKKLTVTKTMLQHFFADQAMWLFQPQEWTRNNFSDKRGSGTPLMAQCLRHCTSTAEGAGSTPSWGRSRMSSGTAKKKKKDLPQFSEHNKKNKGAVTSRHLAHIHLMSPQFCGSLVNWSFSVRHHLSLILFLNTRLALHFFKCPWKCLSS